MRMLLTTATVLAALLSGCAQEQDMDLAERAAVLAKTIAAEHDHVTVAELSDWIIKDRREFELIDIRSQEEFATDHIRGARHVPLAGLMEDASLRNLPKGRKVVLYSNGTAHAAQAALLLRLVDRDAYALLGGINYWHAYLNDPNAAGVAEMDVAQRAQYQAVSCFLAGEYVAAAGLPSKQSAPEAARLRRRPIPLGWDSPLASVRTLSGRQTRRSAPERVQIRRPTRSDWGLTWGWVAKRPNHSGRIPRCHPREKSAGF